MKVVFLDKCCQTNILPKNAISLKEALDIQRIILTRNCLLFGSRKYLLWVQVKYALTHCFSTSTCRQSGSYKSKHKTDILSCVFLENMRNQITLHTSLKLNLFQNNLTPYGTHCWRQAASLVGFIKPDEKLTFRRESWINPRKEGHQ